MRYAVYVKCPNEEDFIWTEDYYDSLKEAINYIRGEVNYFTSGGTEFSILDREDEDFEMNFIYSKWTEVMEKGTGKFITEVIRNLEEND